jgi:hypothetical protein
MVAIVNGYVCFSTCDAKSAQQNKDPNAPPGSAPGTKAHKPGDPPSNLDGQPATVLGGALQDLLEAQAVKPSASSQSANPPPARSVDRLA